MTLKIYGVPLSVHTRKVLLAARLKAVAYELQIVIPVVPGNPPPNWRELSPTGLIPVLEHEGFRLADSTAIIHYLERKHPTPALAPTDDRQFATALFLDAWAGRALFQNVIHPIFLNQVVNPNIRKVPVDEAAIGAALNSAAPDALDYLESLKPQRHLVGETLTIADLAVVSNLILFNYLGKRIDGARNPRVKAYFDNQIASPLFRAALQEETPFVDNMGLDRTFLD